jgi:CheY-like chemotaxis protein
MVITAQLVSHLRSALDHLCDPDKLHHNSLAPLLGVAGRVDTPVILRQILIAAIESLQPKTDVPRHSPVWRAYNVLLYRYVQQRTQRDVADQMALSVRHLRREQEAALEMLARQLWARFDLGAELGVSRGKDPPSASREAGLAVNENSAWLRDSALSAPANIAQVLAEVLRLARPLAVQHGVHMQITLPDTLPDVAVHASALQQALLSLLPVAMHRSPGGRVLIAAKSTLWNVEVEVLATSPRPGPRPILNDDITNLDMARRLVNVYGGKLTLSSSEAPFAAWFILPALERLLVLAIDNNEDALQLLKRYTSGTRYRLVGTRDPEEALSLVEKTSPGIIVLDVMMQQVDGWELLGRLRQYPLTARVPIVVCTIRAQAELALSLGASGLLWKPVSQQTFLGALDRQILIGRQDLD